MSAAENVTRLPTASKRIVRQKCNRASRAARTALREQQGQEFPYINPGSRAAMKDAELILNCKRTPELSLVMAMWTAMPEDMREQATAMLKIMAMGGGSAEQALALVKRRTVGERVDLDRMMDLLKAK